jgi:hypothetical protein
MSEGTLIRTHRLALTVPDRSSTMTALGAQDVLMFVKSEDIIRLVLPPDAHDEALRSVHAEGFYSSPPGQFGGHMGPSSDAGYFGSKPVREKEIPEAEAEAIRRASRAVSLRHKTLHVVDVGKESPLRRVIEEHLHQLHDFPVLMRPDGRRLEGAGNFTDENLAKFLSD